MLPTDRTNEPLGKRSGLGHAITSETLNDRSRAVGIDPHYHRGSSATNVSNGATYTNGHMGKLPITCFQYKSQCRFVHPLSNHEPLYGQPVGSKPCSH